jgi:hypothetical protein
MKILRQVWSMEAMAEIESEDMDQPTGSRSQSQYPELYQTPSFPWSAQTLDDINQTSSSLSSGPSSNSFVDPAAQIHYSHHHSPTEEEAGLHSSQPFNRGSPWQSVRQGSSHLDSSHSVQYSVADDQYADGSME